MSEEEKEGSRDVTSDSSGLLGVHLSSDHDTEDEASDQELPLPPGLDWLDDLSEEDDGEGDFKVGADYGKKRSYAETARMFKLRRNLDQLDSFHQQKEHDVLKAREALNLCCQNIKSLLEQRDNLEDEIEQQKAADNSVAVFRLRAQHKNLCQRLQSEEELEGHINTELKQLELELSKVELELGKFSALRQEVQEEERIFQILKAQKAATRLQQEREAGQNLQLKMQHLRDKQAAMMRKEEQESQKKFEESQAHRKTAAKYLKQSTRRIHQQEAEKEQQNQQLLEKRIQAVESLKSNIAAAQETLRVQQIRVKANAQKKEKQQRQLKESLQTQDITSIKHMYQQKKQEEIKQKQLEFKERQQSKKVEIVAKMLQEEQLVMSSKRHQAKMPKPSTADRLPSPGKARENLLHYLDPSPPSPTEERDTVQSRQFSGTSSSSSASSNDEDSEDTTQQEVDHQRLTDSLAEPEFCGLWDQNYKMLPNEKTTVVQTKVQVEEPALACGKPSVPAKKVHGKELKTAPFTSKPEVILFKDFEVGQTYKKKIVLTNVGYTTNHCKLLGMCTRLTDFVSINFESPGFLSAGMSCELQAVFQPMINEDMDGHILFTSGAGSFSVPVRCTTKKCELEVDSQLLDFGSHVVGQTISRTITLMNKGALGTLFSLDTSTCLIPETHYVQTPLPVPAVICQETNDQSTTSSSQNSSTSTSTDTGEIQPQPDSQEPAEATQHEKSNEGTEAVGGARLLTVVEVQADESVQDSSDISLGNVQDGEIGPFQSIKLEVVFTPTVPGEAKLGFLIKFSHPSSKPIPVQVRGIAVSIPVWVIQPNIDLKICMFDCLYQDTITVQSRASTALKVTFEVCPEMRKHMDIVPKTGFIQAQSSFNAQLRFLPRLSLSKDVKTCFDSDTGVLEVPAEVQVAGQVQPVHLTVHAVVTSSDLQFESTEVDFGYCSIFQSVKSSVRLTNMSLLPQDFGFLDAPEFIEVQPNDGFGTLLPQETLQIDLIFSPSKVKDYNFQLHCKSGINRDFLLSCRAVGVRPPLELSHSLVKFGATALGDHSTAVLYLINPQTSRNQSKPPVTAAAKDALTPVAPRLFSFVLPKKCSHVSIAPSTGRLLPGEKCLVQVTFRPKLLEQEIKREVIRLHQQARLLRERELNLIKEQEAKESSKKKKSSAKRRNSKMSDEQNTYERIESPKPDDLQQG
ncbi:hypothetical protein JOB18_016556 [Solea senegalensis]|uniref:Cilia- and flagella-associated protein 74 n=1 Tax=Solea senegalensis TaxID=28829 RepID=A0AAV6SSH6_SOLSE|nr:cilia- and flagella-associated protein 74 isoform X1 [Solea senegalensis]KAG7519814.1 hypothetical protein JOB18_016556 [Solea senegalensis]